MNKLVKIFGKLTDFNGNIIPQGNVEIKDATFNDAYKTQTDENGNFSLEVQSGIYMGMIAVKDYAISKLEYWCWNLPALEDIEINMKIDSLEVYAINAFLVQIGHPNSSMMIYFRPMSLKRYKKLAKFANINSDIIDISPDLCENDIDVTINEEPVRLLEINKVTEQAVENNQKMRGYFIQTTLPKNTNVWEYYKIHIVLRDNETGEKGEGDLFLKRPEVFDFFIK